MKLSIITIFNKRKKQLKKFLRKINSQTDKDFEVIMIFEQKNKNVLSSLDYFFKESESKIKIIFNSQRQGRTNSIKQAIKQTNGEYTLILPLTNGFKNTMVSELKKLIEQKNTDIIEFNAKMKKPIKFKGKIRKKFFRKTIISENPEIIAKTYPFDFNKIFRSSILKTIALTETIININSTFCLEFVFKAFIYSKTYSNCQKNITWLKEKIDNNFRPIKLLNQWKEIEKMFSKNNLENKFLISLEYAKFFNVIYFIFGFLGLLKEKILLKKFYSYFKKRYTKEYKEFLLNNIYILEGKDLEVKNLKKFLTIKRPNELTWILRTVSDEKIRKQIYKLLT